MDARPRFFGNMGVVETSRVLRQDHQFRLGAAAHSVSRSGVERTRVVLVAAWGVRLDRYLLVGAADDRVIRVKRRVGAERDHETSVLVRGHPNYLSACLNAEELVVLR